MQPLCVFSTQHRSFLKPLLSDPPTPAPDPDAHPQHTSKGSMALPAPITFGDNMA